MSARHRLRQGHARGAQRLRLRERHGWLVDAEIVGVYLMGTHADIPRRPGSPAAAPCWWRRRLPPSASLCPFACHGGPRRPEHRRLGAKAWS